VLLTRKELFDLVWSVPRTELAKRFKVSDVAVAKRCRSTNIPMPPPGYWARVAAGAKTKRPELPLRIPGGNDQVAIGESRSEPPATAATTSDLKVPCFLDEVDSLVDAAVKRLGLVKAQRDLADVHSGLARILKKEEQRRKKFTETRWSFYEPKYDDPVSQRKLRLYSALFRSFEPIGIKGAVSEKEEWKQGIGTTNWLSGSLEFDGARVELLFVPVQMEGKPSRLKLLVGGDTEAKAHSVWSDDAHLPIEKQLDEIARGILVCAEVRMRVNAQWQYEWRLKERERRAEEEEQRRRAEEVNRATQIEREQKQRREAVHVAAARRRKAEDIRSLVAALVAAHPELVDNTRFKGWCRFALTEADSIDPVRRDWIELLKDLPHA
jgi:hypothetical protein